MISYRPDSPVLVSTHQSFVQMLEHLGEQKTIAMDTESDSLFSYYPKVCLIQISASANGRDHEPSRIVDYLVDPLRLEHLDGLQQLLAGSAIEVVMHAAENDMASLQRDFSFRFTRIFDTQLAARILGWRKVGLAAILEDKFGQLTDKRMQRTNWGKRPLTPQQIAYAQVDTHFLMALRKLQIEELLDRQRLEEASDAFGMLAQVDFSARPPNTRTVWQMKAARSIPRENTGVLESLWLWREKEAQRQNRPPFKIMTDRTLIDLATCQPTTQKQLSKTAASGNQIRRYGKSLLKVIRQGRERPLPKRPKSNRRTLPPLDDAEMGRYQALRRWRVRTAKRRGVNVDVILDDATLVEIARRAPSSVEDLEAIPKISPWKANHYAADLLSLVAD